MTLNPKYLYRPLPLPGEIAAWDQLSESEFGVPTLLLMENAARAALQVLREEMLVRPGLRVLVLAGGGNNGGDGIALGRHLHEAGCEVLVLTLHAPGRYRGIARRHLKMAVNCGTRVQTLRLVRGVPRFSPDLPAGWMPDLVVDALVGAGFKSPLGGLILDLVRWLNAGFGTRRAYVMALDMPSGLGALSGRPEPEAVRADLTVAFAVAKPGLILPWAEEFTGRLLVREIGLPGLAAERHAPSFLLTAPARGVLDLPIPVGHKGHKGKILILGGSSGLTGAPVLASLGALRGGAGLVTLAAPAGLCQEMKSDHPEIMTLPLGGTGKVCWGTDLLPQVIEFIRNMGEHAAVVIGPGLGRAPDARAFLAGCLEALNGLDARPPLLVDADALYFFRLVPGKDEFGLHLLRASDIITPHAGELRRIFGSDSAPAPQELEERAVLARRFCVAVGASGPALLYKGPVTLLGQGSAPLRLVPFAEANLAVGGSGDVLSGLCAALMARGYPTLDAAALGAYLHARAGRLSRRSYPAGGNLPQDIAFCIPDAFAELY